VRLDFIGAMRRREAKAISNLKFQISNESERQSEVEDRRKKKAKSKEPWNAGSMKGELRGEASLAEEKAAASRPSAPLRTSRTPYEIWGYLRCGFYGAGGCAGRA
jgi:hypothetical protein